ncbi:MAG: phytanoyl-CoA dioxygenase family protein [Candidatus Hydrogenedentes bacterium]|nr:phytanoyl-CoA dioxygenase family protein [Candidatus Hydrogenedentota bacterium]
MFELSPAQLAQYEADGYVMVEQLFSREEMDLLLRIGKADRKIQLDATDRSDSQGFVTRLTVRNTLESDMYSAIARCRRVVRPMEQLLGGEVYHYHHKMMLKEPEVGGAWEWHQDYGYWYNNGCLYPLMASCMIAVDRATKANGCLQVVPGSQHLGRLDHGKVAGQTGVDPERMAQVLERLPLVYAEMEPGTALFFHGNTLHRSDANLSKDSRWTLICCYNAARNNPYKEHHHPCYMPLEQWQDERVLEAGKAHWAELEQALAQGVVAP